MSETIATNIRLPEEMLKALKYGAIEERESMNRLVREALEAFLTAGPGPESPEKDPMEEIIEIGRSGIRDGSSSMTGTSMEKSDEAFRGYRGLYCPDESGGRISFGGGFLLSGFQGQRGAVFHHQPGCLRNHELSEGYGFPCGSRALLGESEESRFSPRARPPKD